MLGDLKLLLGIDAEDVSKDDILNFCIGFVTDMILNYCNIDSVPKRLNSVVVAACCDCYRGASFGRDSLAGEEKSISEGDTTVQYVTAADIMAVASCASFLNPYKSQLNRFRRVVFP